MGPSPVWESVGKQYLFGIGSENWVWLKFLYIYMKHSHDLLIIVMYVNVYRKKLMKRFQTYEIMFETQW